jgi:hypothetical protein
MPEKPFSWVPKENLLSFEELFEFIKIAIDEGVKRFVSRGANRCFVKTSTPLSK